MRCNSCHYKLYSGLDAGFVNPGPAWYQTSKKNGGQREVTVKRQTYVKVLPDQYQTRRGSLGVEEGTANSFAHVVIHHKMLRCEQSG